MSVVVILVLLAVLGITFETARLMEVTNSLQTAADSAAASAVRSLANGQSSAIARGEAHSAFQANLEANGLDATLANRAVNPVASTAPMTVQVTADYSVKLSMMQVAARAFGIPETRRVRVRSNAKVPVIAAMIVMDVSDSMRQYGLPNTRYDTLRAALPSLIDGMTVTNGSVTNMHSGLMFFGAKPLLAQPLNFHTPAHRTAMNSLVAGLPTDPSTLSYSSNTNLSESLRLARRELASYSAAPAGAQREIIFGSDGAPAGGLIHFHSSAVTANLPTTATDPESGSNYVYRIYTGHYPKSHFQIGGPDVFRHGGDFALISADGLRANIFVGSRLENPATNAPPATCGTRVPSPDGGTYLARGTIGVRRGFQNCTLALANCNYAASGGSAFSSLTDPDAIYHCGNHVPSCFGLHATQDLAAPWCADFRPEYGDNCFITTGAVKLQYTSTRVIDGTTLNRSLNASCAPSIPSTAAMVNGMSRVDIYHVSLNQFLLESQRAADQGIKVHTILVGDSDHTLNSENGAYQGWDDTSPRRFAMYYASRQHFQRSLSFPYGTLMNAGAPVAIEDFPELNPVSSAASFAFGQQSRIFFTNDSSLNLAMLFQSYVSSRRMSFTP